MAGKANRIFLGVDTSAYTTSLALIDEEERLVWEKRSMLPVGEGKLGLRQSEAVFSHLQNLPSMMEEAKEQLCSAALTGVAASTRPRPVTGSYMPVFKVSEAFGRFAAQTGSLFFMPSSHQEGHIMAGLWSAGLPQGRYLVVHLSGGTTEILIVEETSPGFLQISLAGGTTDLNAGQFVDRLGVEMGLPFPAGAALEILAQSSMQQEVRLPIAVKATQISFSGPASHAQRLLQQGCPRPELARAVERCIADSLTAAAGAALQSSNCRGILVVGGVAANSFIRSRFTAGLPQAQVSFADAAVAGDNAVGLAVQLARRYTRGQGIR